MKDYYKILGVSPSAHAANIKRAFRQLAIRYHPDKNADPSAEVIFKEINEAYEVLSDPTKKADYDWRRQNPLSDVIQEPSPPRHRDPAYHKPRRKPANVKSERQRMVEMMTPYVSAINLISVFCFAFSSLLMIDYLLPNRKSEEIIVETNLRTFETRRSAASWGVIITDHGNEINLPSDYETQFRVNDKIIVHASLIFGVCTRVDKDEESISIRRSIYGNFFFAPVLLFILSLFAVVSRKNIERAFNLGISCILVLIFTGLIFLFL